MHLLRYICFIPLPLRISYAKFRKRSEQRNFISALREHLDSLGQFLPPNPRIESRNINYQRLYLAVRRLGGYDALTDFIPVCDAVGIPHRNASKLRQLYRETLYSFEQTDTKPELQVVCAACGTDDDEDLLVCVCINFTIFDLLMTVVNL